MQRDLGIGRDVAELRPVGLAVDQERVAVPSEPHGRGLRLAVGGHRREPHRDLGAELLVGARVLRDRRRSRNAIRATPTERPRRLDRWVGDADQVPDPRVLLERVEEGRREVAARDRAARAPSHPPRPTYEPVAGSSVSIGAATTVQSSALSRRIAASRRCSAATFAYGPATSSSSKTFAFAAITIRRGPSRSIASTISRVASEISVVVSSAIGPSAETTASAPASAVSTALRIRRIGPAAPSPRRGTTAWTHPARTRPRRRRAGPPGRRPIGPCARSRRRSRCVAPCREA